MDRLLRRAALAVDRHRRHALGKFRGQDGVPGEGEGLLAGLGDAPEDDVLDRGGVESVALHQRVEHVGAEVGGMGAGEAAIATPTGRAHRIDDIGLRHDVQVSWNVGRRRAR